MLFYIVYPIFYFIGLLPYRAQSVVASALYFLFYKVIGYRVAVVRDNLSRAFPEKSAAELLTIEKKYFRHLSDMFIETMLLSAISEKKMRQRIEFINADQIEQFTEGRSWISAMAHYGTWELTTSWGLYSRHGKVFAVYRPLRSKWLDRYYLKTRARFGVHPLSMESVGREIIHRRGQNENSTIAMIADQSPIPVRRVFSFFGRKTPFFEGMEKLALKFNMPIAFLHIDKFEKGRYKAWFEVIYDGVEKVEKDEITRRYVEKLEQMIRARPELWMWSHRRWKRCQ